MNLPDAILDTRQKESEFPFGTVVSVSSTTMTVLVRGTSVAAAYVDLGASTPKAGDRVIMGRQDAAWRVFGRQAGVGTNEVVNPSFEADGAHLGVPSSWFQFTNAGNPAISTQLTGYAPSGSYELAVSSGGGAAADTYIYSSPINVSPGQTWAVSGLATAIYPAGAPFDADVALYAFWFANNTNLYPTTSAADTLINQVNNIGQAPGHTSVSGTVVVPGGAVYMRVATRSIANAAITVQWDAIEARNVT